MPGREIAVADQPDARAGRADVRDQLLVARAVEHHDDEVLDLALERLGDRPSGSVFTGRSRLTVCRARGPTTSFSM